MFPAPHRRDFLYVLLGGATGLCLPSRGFGQEPPALQPRPGTGQKKPTALTATRLTDNLSLITGAGGNVVVVAGPDGVALVNGGRAEQCSALLKLVGEQAPGKRVTTLFNTDWHPNHTGSNETLGKAGAAIIAHE